MQLFKFVGAFLTTLVGASLSTTSLAEPAKTLERGTATAVFEVRPEKLAPPMLPLPLVWFDEAPYAVTVDDRTLQLWHATPRTAAPIESVALDAPLAMHGLALGSAGSIATLTESGQLRVWSGTLTPLAHIDTTATNKPTQLAAVGLGRGVVAFTGDRMGVIHTVNWGEPKTIRDIAVDVSTVFRTLVLSPDETHLLAETAEHVVLIELSSGRIVDRLTSTGHTHGFSSARFAPDGKSWWVVQDTTAFQRSMTGKALQNVALGVKDGPTTTLTFSPDGRWLFATDGASVCRHALPDGALRGEIGVEAWSKAVGIAADGTRALTVTSGRLTLQTLTWP